MIPLKKIKIGTVLYEKDFICSVPAKYSTKSETQSVILEISKAKMIEILKERPEDFEKFNVIKENIAFNNGFRKVHNFCQICGQSHEIQRCPFTFFQVNKQRLWREYKKKEELNREEFTRKFKMMPGFRICRLDYLDGAIQAGLNNVLIEEDDITAEFLENIGFPMKGLQEELIGGKVIKEQDEEDEEESISQEKLKKYQKEKSSSLNSDFSCSNHSQSEIEVVKDIGNKNENNQIRNSIEPNFQLMKKVRQYSVLNNIDPSILQAYRGIDAKRISRVEKKTELKGKMDSFESNNSLKSQQSSKSAEANSRKKLKGKNFQQIFKRNFEKEKTFQTQLTSQNYLQFGQFQQQQSLLQLQQNETVQLQQLSIQQTPSINLNQMTTTSSGSNPIPLISLVPPNQRLSSSSNYSQFVNLPIQVQSENMLDILEIEFHSKNQHEIFTELDKYLIILKFYNRHEYYDFYFPQFNFERVLKKLLSEFNKRRFQQKMSQIEFQQLRQKTINRFSKMQKSQSILGIRSMKD